jgi:hypothetical protein
MATSLTTVAIYCRSFMRPGGVVLAAIVAVALHAAGCGTAITDADKNVMKTRELTKTIKGDDGAEMILVPAAPSYKVTVWDYSFIEGRRAQAP